MHLKMSDPFSFWIWAIFRIYIYIYLSQFLATIHYTLMYAAGVYRKCKKIMNILKQSRKYSHCIVKRKSSIAQILFGIFLYVLFLLHYVWLFCFSFKFATLSSFTHKRTQSVPYSEISFRFFIFSVFAFFHYFLFFCSRKSRLQTRK